MMKIESWQFTSSGFALRTFFLKFSVIDISKNFVFILKLIYLVKLTFAFITIASVLNDEDYRKIGRGLESLGLQKMGKEEMIKYVEEGV